MRISNFSFFSLILSFILLSGCANPLNSVTYDRYMSIGAIAEERGDLVTAEEAFSWAYTNSQIGHLSKREQFLSLQDLGRVKQKLGLNSEAKEVREKADGIADQLYAEAKSAELEKGQISSIVYLIALLKRDLCKLDEAEALFKEALALEDQNQSADQLKLSHRTCELAHLYSERQKYDDAGRLYDRCVTIAKEMGIEQIAPAEFAYVLEEYIEALKKSGRETESTHWGKVYEHLMTTGVVTDGPKPPWEHSICQE